MNRLIFRGSALLLMTMAMSCASSSGDNSSAMAGKPAPDFSRQTLDSRSIQLSELKGNVVVLDFWATWCTSCRQSLPHLSAVANDPAMAARGLRVIAIDCRESPQTATDYLRTNNLSLPVVSDADGSLEDEYRITILPTTLIIGRDGSIAKVLSTTDPSAFDAALSQIINAPN